MSDGKKTAAGVAGAVAAVAATIAAKKVYDRLNKPTAPRIAGGNSFTYVGNADSGEYEGKIFYSDSYFTKPGTEYDISLGTASLCFALSCGNSLRGFGFGYVNAEKLLQKLGFEDIEHNSGFQEIPTVNTVGAIIGRKTVEGKTLLAVGIRGIGYKSEWGGNFLVGTGVYHQGFDEASDRVLDFLMEYIEKHGIENDIKVWVTGYSRSASTANLVAGKLDTSIAENHTEWYIGKARLSKKDVYAYCFEPAETVMNHAYDIHGPDYCNIWNHVNPNDPVPIVVTSCFGMERFGTDMIFPSKGDPGYAAKCRKMKSYYDVLPNREELGPYKGDKFAYVDVKALIEGNSERPHWDTQADFLRDFNQKFTEFVGSREFYADTMQKGFSEALGKRMGEKGNGELLETIFYSFTQNKIDFALSIYNIEKENTEMLKAHLWAPVHTALKKAGMGVSMTDDFCSAIAESVMVFKDFIAENKLMVFNFIINLKPITFAHYPELIWAWMQSFDPNYGSYNEPQLVSAPKKR